MSGNGRIAEATLEELGAMLRLSGEGRAIRTQNVITKEPLVRQMQRELETRRPRIDGIEHGKVTLIVQDGRLVRMEITESAKAETA